MEATRFVSVQEAASLLGVSLTVVDRLIANGLLSRWRIRGKYGRVLRSQVDELSTLPTEWLQRS